MSKYIITKIWCVWTLLIMAMSYSQSSNENYFQATTCLDADCIKKAITVKYYDGLGRTKQIVNVKASPLGRDVVTHFGFDQFGRQVRDYLPVPQANTLNGNIIADPLANATQPNIYGSEKIYAERKLENSPEDQLDEQTRAGTAWSNFPVKFSYVGNTANEVRRYVAVSSVVEGAIRSTIKVSGNSDGDNGYYKANTLYKNSTSDEDGNVIHEYKNGHGQIVLIRRVLGNNISSNIYYIYNEYNQLACTISPKAADEIVNLPMGSTIPDQVLNDLCYQYRYDGKGRVVEKKLPGKGWEYYVYDNQDRLALSQDAMLRTSNNSFHDKGWLFTKYDNFNRVVLTGYFKNTESRQQVQNTFDNLTTVNNETRVPNAVTVAGVDVYYRNLAYPSTNIILLTINYYDTYPAGSPALPSNVLDQYTLKQTLDSGHDRSTNGLRTAYFIKNIENDDWTKNYDYYDSNGRLVLTKSFNHLGGYTHKEFLLDFAGILQKEITYHKRLNTDQEKVITQTFIYDSQNRLLKNVHKVNTYTPEIIVQNTYNELSQIENKKVGGIDALVPIQSIDYKYNIHGWLTHLNNPQSLGNKLFAFELKYTNPTAPGPAVPHYNGNIAEMDWASTESNGLRRYSYIYDALGRLESGLYSEPGVTLPQNDYYSELLSYDINGNIKTLKRYRNAPNIGKQFIDNLTYSYTGNRLNTVVDDSGNYYGYPDTSGCTITYDDNGNMTTHTDRGMLQIDYNYLNLPNYIKFNRYVSRRGQLYYVNTDYLYRADGVKLTKRYNYFIGTSDLAAVSHTDYLDGFQYSDDGTGLIPDKSLALTLQFVPTAEGYYDFVQNKYIYQYKDQVGNVRLAYYRDRYGNAAVDRSTDYYPFGLEFGGNGLNISGSLSPTYQYSFQEQEKQEETGWSSFKWRNYDPSIGRFFNVDPLSEKYAYQSHYNFSENKVVNARELEGLEAVLIGPGGVPIPAATPVPGGTVSGAGAYTELKGYTQNSLRFWGGVANKGLNLLMAGGTVGIAVMSKVLKSEAESKTKVQNENKNENENKSESLEINIPDEDKIPRDELDPPTKPGNAPTFKKDGKAVEIHHEGQNAKGPFKEMHPEDHRGKGNYRKNHPKGQKPLTKQERIEFNNSRQKYWKKEYPNTNK
ncbi:DUF6443 domain-containing protein [Chryseobacterium taichungense]|uniref:DUF6443 domain-containing protein n=1 Tax=Chryseobacterium taichungense TaxID=295069 RepID=UPI0028ABABAA|nr:DUF6443 domain-containing protein [Chryseobacterium taichungense]